MTAGNQFVRALLPGEMCDAANSTSVPGSLKQHFRILSHRPLGSFGKDASLLLRRFVQKPRPPGFFIKNKDHNCRLTYHAEHMPHSDGRVTLSRSCDRLGVNQISIDLRFKAEDARSVVRVHELLSRWLLRSGLCQPQPSDLPPEALLDAIAEASLPRYSPDRHDADGIISAKNGPVDKDLRCFDVANLYVLQFVEYCRLPVKPIQHSRQLLWRCALHGISQNRPAEKATSRSQDHCIAPAARSHSRRTDIDLSAGRRFALVNCAQVRQSLNSLPEESSVV